MQTVQQVAPHSCCCYRGEDLVVYVLNQSLTVVHPDSQILVLLQGVDDLILQSQILFHLRIKKKQNYSVCKRNICFADRVKS